MILIAIYLLGALGAGALSMYETSSSSAPTRYRAAYALFKALAWPGYFPLYGLVAIAGVVVGAYRGVRG